MRDHDDFPYIVIERRSAGLGAFLWGALIGAGAALLLAPRPGAQLQQDIRQGVRRARTAAEERVDAARSTVHRARETVEHGFETVRERVDTVRDQIGTVRDRFEARAERVRDVVDSGLDMARDAAHAATDAGADAGVHSAPGRSDVDVVVVDIADEHTDRHSELG